MNLKIIFNKKGQTAILATLLFLVVILAVSTGLIVLIVREIKMARNVTDSAQALAAADAGMEYVIARKSKDLDIEFKCEDDDWRDLLDGGSEYCTRFVMYTATEGYYSSVGRSGSVRRAIFTPVPDSLDQFAKIGGKKVGHDICRCDGPLQYGPELDNPNHLAAQTFMAGRDGELFAAFVNFRANSYADIETGNFKAEIRDIDPYLIDAFNPEAGKPGSTVLASTTDFYVGEHREWGCHPGGKRCANVVFNFDPPLNATSGERYTLVVQNQNWGGDYDAVCCCTERRYIPGKGWRWNGVAWVDAYQGHGFDLDFGVYIAIPAGSEYAETKP